MHVSVRYFLSWYSREIKLGYRCSVCYVLSHSNLSKFRQLYGYFNHLKILLPAPVGLSREHHIISNLFFNVSFVHSCLVTEMFYMSCLCSEKLPWVVLRIVCFLPDVVCWNGLLSQLMYVPYLQSQVSIIHFFILLLKSMTFLRSGYIIQQ